MIQNHLEWKMWNGDQWTCVTRLLFWLYRSKTNKLISQQILLIRSAHFKHTHTNTRWPSMIAWVRILQFSRICVLYISVFVVSSYADLLSRTYNQIANICNHKMLIELQSHCLKFAYTSETEFHTPTNQSQTIRTMEEREKERGGTWTDR